jgi:hypothetical protein
MVESGKLYAPAVLHRGKQASEPNRWEIVWAPELVWKRLRKIPACARNRNLFLQPVVIHLLSYPGS